MQGIDQRHQLGALGLGGQHAQQPLAGAAVALVATRGQGVHQPFELDVGVAELAGVDQMLGELTRQPQHHRGDRGRVLLGPQLPAVSVDHVEGQLPELRLAEQPGVGFDRLRVLPRARRQQTVLAQQLTGEGVVGADHRRAGGLAGQRARLTVEGQTGAAEPGQPGPDPPQQLPGRLAGERQAQHLTGIGVAVGHQPHHPRCHRLGLAGTGSRDHHQRPRRSGDDRRLFLGGLEKPECAG